MNPFTNLDLLSVGIAIAGTALLGVLILLNNIRSATNRAFFYFAFVTVCWSIVNYAYYQFPAGNLAFWLLRLVIFFATWHAFTFFNLSLTFPNTKIHRPWWCRFLILPVVVITSILTLSPLVFKQVTLVSSNGTIGGVQNGPGIAVFGIVVLCLVLSGIILLARKTWTAPKDQRRPYSFLFYGMLVTFILLLTFNMVIPAAFNNPRFIQLGALFLFPLVLSSSFSILRYHLFNIKVAAIGVLSFALSMAILFNILFANSFSALLFSLSEFVLVLIFSFWLIQSVLREVGLREEIQQLALNLENTNEQLSEFMSLATHEIRNPATAIKGIAANALEGLMGDMSPSIRDSIQKMFVRANDIINLGNQYLDKSKLELNQIVYAFETFPLSTLVENLVYEFQPAAAQHEETVTASIDKNLDSTVTADKGKIKEVIANLIDNSIKYNVPKGSVTVSLLKGTDTVTVKISDTGAGIPAETIPKLFKKFSRADASKANLLGTGLGLYLAKTFIDAHHGRIWVESEGLGKGSTFFVELPIKQEQAPKAPASNTVATPTAPAV